MKLTNLLLCLCILVAFTRCGGKKEQPSENQTVDSIAFKQPLESELDTAILISEDTTGKGLILGKGPVRKLWERAYRWCGFKTQITGSSPVYLGPANTFRMGTIIDNKGNSFNTLHDLLTDEQKKKLFNYGSATPCDFQDDSKKKIEAVLKANLDFGDAELNSMVESERKVLFKIDSFKVNSIWLDRLSTELSKTTSEDLKGFKESLAKEKRLFLTHEIEVIGFNATINLDNNISNQLKTKIDQGVITKVADGKADFDVEIVNSRTIKIASKKSIFIPFAACVKAEFVK